MTFSDADRAAIEARHIECKHQARGGQGPWSHCDDEGKSHPWPCDTARVLAAISDAEADAKRLAERLQSHTDQHWSHGGAFYAKDCGICQPDLAALALHRERRSAEDRA